jgi:membrane fusion protein, adhesin transport system
MFLDSKTQNDKLREFESFRTIIAERSDRKYKKFTSLLLLGLVILLMLPWTQNIQSKGMVSTLEPAQRPQEINAAISGQIIKWYIRDGQQVKKGDTLLQLAEIKEDYLDSNLLRRVDEQIQAKSASVGFYKQKATTTQQQERALISSMNFKIDQLKNKLYQYTRQVQTDSVNLIAARNAQKIAAEQLKRQQELYAEGLKSLTDLEYNQQ